MARFLVKASEFKNVCKAVNDSKLTELKKEIIEILKKQDEKEVKKAIDYFNSQELHYTHLEKSFTGKWVEKAGYGIGTVRIWKGKKYKKIAPGKWARVFEKEGRGTNIAIGKLIAKVQKIDNVEDLMAFVMANKQRFVDENGVDLPVLDKLRAAVDARNGNVGSKEKTEKNFDSKEVLANLDKYVKTIGGVYGIKKYTEDDDTEKTFARIKDHFDSDSTRTYDDAEGWNQAARQISEYAKKEGLSTDELIKQSIKNNIKDESIEGTPTFGGKKTEYMERLEEQSKKAEEGRNRQTETKVNGYGEATDREITSLAYKRDVARKERDFNSYFGRGMDKKNNNRGYSKPAEKKSDRPFKNAKKEDLEFIVEQYKKQPPTHEIARKQREQAIAELSARELEKPAEKETPKAKRSNVKVFADKSSVGTFTKVDENTVEMSATKETIALFDSLKKSVSKDDTRPFMTDCYYDGENIISTDGRRLVCIKAGNIGLDEGFVKVKTENGKVKIEKFEKDFGDSQVKQFPNYKRVMPDKNEQQVSLDSKRLKEKLKEMKKDGAYDATGRVALEFKDGKVILDGTAVGQSDAKLDGINFISFYAEHLIDAIINDNGQTMFISDNPMKAVSISDGSSDIVIMPMVHYEDSNGNPKVPDYDENRAEKNAEREAKSEKKAAMKKKNQDYMADLINRYKRSVPANFEERSIKNIQEWSTEQLERMYKVANADIDSLMEKKEFNSNAFSSFTNKNYDMSPERLIQQNYAMKEHPAIVRELERLIKERGGKIEKSLFDGFLLESLLEDEEDFDDEDETEYNDYSAEQPELFNSTEFKVREALNRRFNCVM